MALSSDEESGTGPTRKAGLVQTRKAGLVQYPPNRPRPAFRPRLFASSPRVYCGPNSLDDARVVRDHDRAARHHDPSRSATLPTSAASLPIDRDHSQVSAGITPDSRGITTESHGITSESFSITTKSCGTTTNRAVSLPSRSVSLPSRAVSLPVRAVSLPSRAVHYRVARGHSYRDVGRGRTSVSAGKRGLGRMAGVRPVTAGRGSPGGAGRGRSPVAGNGVPTSLVKPDRRAADAWGVTRSGVHRRAAWPGRGRAGPPDTGPSPCGRISSRSRRSETSACQARSHGQDARVTDGLGPPLEAVSDSDVFPAERFDLTPANSSAGR